MDFPKDSRRCDNQCAFYMGCVTITRDTTGAHCVRSSAKSSNMGCNNTYVECGSKSKNNPLRIYDNAQIMFGILGCASYVKADTTRSSEEKDNEPEDSFYRDDPGDVKESPISLAMQKKYPDTRFKSAGSSRSHPRSHPFNRISTNLRTDDGVGLFGGNSDMNGVAYNTEDPDMIEDYDPNHP